MTGTELTQVDGITAEAYDGHELAIHDTVWVAIPGLLDTGMWAVVDEDGDASEPTVSVRYWGEQYPHSVQRANIRYVMLHDCECGATGPTSWRICHPDA